VPKTLPSGKHWPGCVTPPDPCAAPGPGYLTRHDQVRVVGAEDLQIRSLLDRQQFADPDGEALRLGISSATWPLFGMLWPSGHELAACMATRPMSPGERILELGCGLGLASLVGHRRGADMTASDCHPLAGGFLRENLRLNHLPPMAYRHGHWTAEHPAPGPGPGLAPVTGRFDLIIGSDLLYERDEEGLLAAFIERHALACAQVWVIDPNRGNRSAFNRHMTGHGFALSDQQLHTLATPGRLAYRGRLLRYCRGPVTPWTRAGDYNSGLRSGPGP
jgi:predicted nicotinamide N-methyase